MAKTWQRLRGNKGGFKPQPWFCAGCQKMHSGTKEKNGTTDRIVCERVYLKEFASRHGFAAA
jgi:hypothetical protein